MNDIRIGDRFLVEVEVQTRLPVPAGNSQYHSHKYSHVRVVRENDFDLEGEVFAASDALLLASERIERPIAEGDRVQIEFTEAYGVVKAVDGGTAWVRLETPLTQSNYADVPITHLVPAPLGVSMEGGE